MNFDMLLKVTHHAQFCGSPKAALTANCWIDGLCWFLEGHPCKERITSLTCVWSTAEETWDRGTMNSLCCLWPFCILLARDVSLSRLTFLPSLYLLVEEKGAWWTCLTWCLRTWWGLDTWYGEFIVKWCLVLGRLLYSLLFCLNYQV